METNENSSMEERIERNWFRKHVDTMLILGAIASSMLWMNGKFNDIEKDIVTIKTVLIMKNIMPKDLSFNKD